MEKIMNIEIIIRNNNQLSRDRKNNQNYYAICIMHLGTPGSLLNKKRTAL